MQQNDKKTIGITTRGVDTCNSNTEAIVFSGGQGNCDTGCTFRYASRLWHGQPRDTPGRPSDPVLVEWLCIKWHKSCLAERSYRVVTVREAESNITELDCELLQLDRSLDHLRGLSTLSNCRESSVDTEYYFTDSLTTHNLASTCWSVTFLRETGNAKLNCWRFTLVPVPWTEDNADKFDVIWLWTRQHWTTIKAQ